MTEGRTQSRSFPHELTVVFIVVFRLPVVMSVGVRIVVKVLGNVFVSKYVFPIPHVFIPYSYLYTYK